MLGDDEGEVVLGDDEGDFVGGFVGEPVVGEDEGEAVLGDEEGDFVGDFVGAVGAFEGDFVGGAVPKPQSKLVPDRSASELEQMIPSIQAYSALIRLYTPESPGVSQG